MLNLSNYINYNLYALLLLSSIRNYNVHVTSIQQVTHQRQQQQRTNKE